MPNWVENAITFLSSDKTIIDDIEKAIKELRNCRVYSAHDYSDDCQHQCVEYEHTCVLGGYEYNHWRDRSVHTTCKGFLWYLNPLENGWDYELALNRWGTKWDINQVDYKRNGKYEILVVGNTPWSIPYSAMYSFAQRNKVEITDLWYEESYNFGKYQTHKATEEMQWYLGDFNSEKQLRNEVPQELIEWYDLVEQLEQMLIIEEESQ